ncbi:FAD:protein FMN transferase [Teredinibacter turnerae]|uniref:FAD:protein FMN transferase n=1 Tax=Teredinibacter turnerae TaxID=2426 RepID=UPI0030D3FDBE
MKKLAARCVILLAGIYSAHAHCEWYSDTQGIMGTEVSITFWHDDPAQAQQLLADGMAEMRRLDRELSPWIESSELATLNRLAAKTPQKISSEMLFLVDKSLYFSHLTHGAFDITFASVGWFYDYREKKQPSEAQRSALLPAINYRWLKLDKAAGTLAYAHDNVRIDLGGIAKGYAVDRVAQLLETAGVRNATISAGGDSQIVGDKRGKPWIIGIKNPRDGGKEEAEAAILLPLENTAISTSGDYERYFIDQKTGERVHHIINPRTGKSVEGVVSVTILGPRGSDTDPMSTSVFVLGVEKGLALVNSLANFECIIIDKTGKVFYSDGLMPPQQN